MVRRIAVWTVILLALIAGAIARARVLPSPIHNVDSKVITPSSNDEIGRQQELTSYLRGAGNVAKLANDPEANQVYSLLVNHGLFSMPLVDGVEAHGEVDALTLPIVVLHEADASLSEMWRYYALHPTLAAAYIPSAKILMVRTLSEPISELWKGVTFLHEGHHAMLHRQGLDFSPEQIYIVEVPTRDFEYRLLNKLGGKSYTRWLDSEVKRLRQECLRQNLAIGTAFPGRKESYPVLDAAFGTPLSETERIFRYTSCWEHACFALIDRYYTGSDSKQEIKARFLRGLGVND